MHILFVCEEPLTKHNKIWQTKDVFHNQTKWILLAKKALRWEYTASPLSILSTFHRGVFGADARYVARQGLVGWGGALTRSPVCKCLVLPKPETYPVLTKVMGVVNWSWPWSINHGDGYWSMVNWHQVNCHKSLGLLCSCVFKKVSQWVSEWQGHLWSCLLDS